MESNLEGYQEKSEAERIAEAASFEDLYNTLGALESVESGSGFYSASRIIARIDELREMLKISPFLFFITIASIPRVHGIRDKVGELLQVEIPEITKIEKNYAQEEKRTTLREEYYEKLLVNEFATDPVIPLIIDTNDTSLHEKLDKMYESKIAVNDFTMDQITKDEDLLIMEVQQTILHSLLNEGSASFSDIEDMFHMHKLFTSNNTPSLFKYALRKGWMEMEEILQNL